MDLFGWKAKRTKKEKESHDLDNKAVQKVFNKWKDEVDREKLSQIMLDMVRMYSDLLRRWRS